MSRVIHLTAKPASDGWLRRVCTAMVFALAAMPIANGGAAATVFTDPLPGVYGNDNGTQTFNPSSVIMAVKLDDPLASFGANTTFGFYFTAAPSVKIPIWDSADQIVGTNFPVAVIDFPAGKVLDFQHSNVQSIFSGFGSIGFYETVDDGMHAPFTLFTAEALNFGTDLAGTFPLLTKPTNYAISFDIPGIAQPIVSLFIVTDVQAVPEPNPLALLLTAASLLTLVRRPTTKPRLP